jgi:hypothetical protein
MIRYAVIGGLALLFSASFAGSYWVYTRMVSGRGA